VKELSAQYSTDTRDALGEGQSLRIEDIPILIDRLEKDMKDLARAMEFEKAAAVRDEISELRKLMGLSDGRIGQEKRKLPGRDRRSR